MTPLTPVRRVDRPTTAAFAAGSVGTGGFGVLPGLVLAYYLTDALGVPPFWASLVVILPKVVDVVIDPLVGALSDRLAARHGHRGRLMRWGAVGLVPAFALTFSAPVQAGPGLAALWVLTFFVLSSIAFSLFQVPYIALPAELTDEPAERTRIVSVRIAVLAGAILAVGGGGPALRDLVGGSAGYVVMGVVVAVVIGAGMLWTAYGAAPRARRHDAGVRVPGRGGDDDRPGRAPVPSLRPSEARQWWRRVRLASDRTFVLLLVAFMSQALGTAVMLGAAQYAATYLLGSSEALTFLFVALVLPAVVVMPAWSRLARRYGKAPAFVVASVVFTAAAVAMCPLALAGGPAVFAVTALAGIGYAGMQAMPLAMFADLLAGKGATGDGGRAPHGENAEGVLAGVWTAGETAAMAFGPTVVLLVLGASGFVASTVDEAVVQPDGALIGIALAFSLVPALFVATGIAVLLAGRMVVVAPENVTPPES